MQNFSNEEIAELQKDIQEKQEDLEFVLENTGQTK